jgi:hypothetical protein
MYQVQKLTTDALQKQVLIFNGIGEISLTIYFRPMQLGWFINELTFNDFTLKGLRICVSPNMLHQFRNQIPFGLACFSVGNREPSLVGDFATGAAQLYVLSTDEVAEYTRFLSA